MGSKKSKIETKKSKIGNGLKRVKLLEKVAQVWLHWKKSGNPFDSNRNSFCESTLLANLAIMQMFSKIFSISIYLLTDFTIFSTFFKY